MCQQSGQTKPTSVNLAFTQAHKVKIVTADMKQVMLDGADMRDTNLISVFLKNARLQEE